MRISRLKKGLVCLLCTSACGCRSGHDRIFIHKIVLIADYIFCYCCRIGGTVTIGNADCHGDLRAARQNYPDANDVAGSDGANPMKSPWLGRVVTSWAVPVLPDTG